MPANKELYQERKNKHLCVKCGEKAKFDKTLCLYHLQEANKNQQALYNKRKSKGSCPKCGKKLTNNRKICNNCLKKNNPNHKRDDIRIPWTDRKKLGLCVACGGPNSTSRVYCLKCRKKYSTKVSLTRKQIIASGLCGSCGKGLLVKNKKRCIICIHKHKKWWASSNCRDKRIKEHKALKQTIIRHYGGKCSCCSETEITFLSIDHINGGGNKHRKKIKKMASSNFNKWIVEQNFPDDLQILCYNCNMSKHLLGECAHKQEK